MMLYEKSIAILQEFLSSVRYSGGLNLDQLLGIIVSTLSCSEYVSDAEIADLVLCDVGEEFYYWFENESLVHTWVNVFNEFTEQLFAETFDLKILCPLATDATAPTQALID
jgi:hypothetical protein